MNKKAATYKYNVSAKSSLICYNSLPYVILVIVIGLIIYLAITQHILFIATLIPLWIIIFGYGKKNEAVTIDLNFMVLGSDIIWYQNIEEIDIHKHTNTMHICTKDSQKFIISSEDFPTNARKDFKIKRNKEGKFLKVSEKIIKKVRAISPQTKIITI